MEGKQTKKKKRIAPWNLQIILGSCDMFLMILMIVLMILNILIKMPLPKLILTKNMLQLLLIVYPTFQKDLP